MKLLIGTSNLAKIADYRRALKHAELELVTPMDIGFIEEPLEAGETFEEISLQKAKFYAERTEYPTLSDDGGLEIEYLDGRPGIESRRWVGPNGTDEDRIQKVFDLMKNAPKDKRSAQFRIVATVYFPAERDYISVEKASLGIIPEKPSEDRTPDFPYDSVLYVPEAGQYWIEDHARFDPRQALSTELLLKLEPYLNS